jgi:hypothetical protein
LNQEIINDIIQLFLKLVGCFFLIYLLFHYPTPLFFRPWHIKSLILIGPFCIHDKLASVSVMCRV